MIGAGKAGASMALAVERHWPTDAPLEGLVITRHGHGMPTERIQVIEAGHPIPDELVKWYIGTIHMRGYVWHVFEELPKDHA